MVDIKPFLITEITCPDYGVLKISRAIPSEALFKFLDIQLDKKKSFKDMLHSIIKDESFDFSSLSERDLDFIAKEISRNYGVESQYDKSREVGIPCAKALSGVLRESPMIKNIKNLAELMKPITEKFTIKSFGIARAFGSIIQNENKINEMMRVQSRFREISKELGGLSRIGKTIEGVERIGNIFEGISAGNMLREHILKTSTEMHRVTQSIIPKLSISETVGQAYRSRMTELFQNIGSIGNALKPVPDLLSTAQEAFRSFETIGERISTFVESFKLTNTALMKSGKIVSSAHDHFSRIDDLVLKIPSQGFPVELAAYEVELIENYEEAEELFHIEAGESIGLSTKLVSALSIQISDVHDEVKDIKNELKKYGALLNRMNILSSPPSFLDFLRRAVITLSEKFWDIFWEKKGEKLVSHPERLIKSHLGLGIELGFGDFAFIGPEIKIGNGFIDLFINFLGTSYIIEFKIIGPGWGIGWAKSGLAQLDHYMNIHNRDESYLVILDGRKTVRGEQLENEYGCEHGRIHVITSRIFWK